MALPAAGLPTKGGDAVRRIIVLLTACLLSAVASRGAEEIELSDSASDLYIFVSTNVPATTDTLIYTNRFTKPWELSSLQWVADTPAGLAVQTMQVARVHIIPDNTKVQVVSTNDWEVYTNYYWQESLSYNTNALCSLIVTNPVDMILDQSGLVLDGIPRESPELRIPSGVYFFGGDLLRLTWSYTNDAVWVQFTGKR